MTDDDFLKVILADPEDDLPRLAYADWLEERGDPRGEFIHLQCALARVDDADPRSRELSAREQELLTQHAKEWLGPLRGMVLVPTFRRGFLEEVVVEPRAYLNHSPLDWPPTLRRIRADLERFEPHPAVVEHIPESVARENRLLPLGFLGTPTVPATVTPHWRAPLVVAMTALDDQRVLETLEFILNRPIEPVLASQDQIERAIDRHYPIEGYRTFTTQLLDLDQPLQTPAGDSDHLVVRLTNFVIRDAALRRAARVRVEPEPDGAVVTYHVAGENLVADRMPARLLQPLVARLRVMAGLPADAPGEQRGSFTTHIGGDAVEVHARLLPTRWGPRAVLDLAAPAGVTPPPDDG